MEKLFPSDYFRCSKEQNPQAGQLNGLYMWVVKKVWGESKKHRMNFDACIVRTAGHDFMDFRYTSDGTATGGSDGCINFEDDDNKGLPGCLVSFAVPDLYQQVCERVSLADFFVIAAEAVMAYRFPKFSWKDRFKAGTLEGKFMRNFRFGRATEKQCKEHVGLMPNPEEGCYDLKRIFIDHIYLDVDKKKSWRFTAAISGVHTLGGAHPENSGYDGTWTFDPSVFNSAYFKRLLDKGWGPEHLSPGKAQWRVSDPSRHRNAVKKQMMFNSDLCLVFDNSLDSANCDSLILAAHDFNKLPYGPLKNEVYRFCKDIRGHGHFLHAREKVCCTWTRPDKMFTTDFWHKKSGDVTVPLPAFYKEGQDNFHCGDKFTHIPNKNFRREGCDAVGKQLGTLAGRIDCDYRGNIEGPAWRAVMDYAYDEVVWIEDFLVAWNISTSNSLNYVQGQDAKAAKRTQQHFTRSARKGNCGCCRQKSLRENDEGYGECEALKEEDTYSKEFWENRTKEPVTWPKWTNEKRPGVLTKLKWILQRKKHSVDWMNRLPWGRE